MCRTARCHFQLQRFARRGHRHGDADLFHSARAIDWSDYSLRSGEGAQSDTIEYVTLVFGTSRNPYS
jgi:hypothetical protein